MKLFNMYIRENGVEKKIKREYIRKTTHNGYSFVVHKSYWGDGYQFSELSSGLAVHPTVAKTTKEAHMDGLAYWDLMEYVCGEDVVKRRVESVKNLNLSAFPYNRYARK